MNDQPNSALPLAGKIIAVDFDGTCVDHCFPKVGEDVPGAWYALKTLVSKGALLMLWTMRSRTPEYPLVLSDAVEWFKRRDIPLWSVNENPTQRSWATGHKQYAHFYIDDAALGCPLLDKPMASGRRVVDWAEVLELLEIPYDPDGIQFSPIGIDPHGYPAYRYKGYLICADGTTGRSWGVWNEAQWGSYSARLATPGNESGSFPTAQDARIAVDLEIERQEAESE